MPYIGNPIYQSAFVTDTFSGTGSQTAFTMSVAPAGTTNVLVVVSGVVQDPSTYGVTGNTLNFTAAPPSGTGNISCRYLGVPVTGVTSTAYRTKTEFTATAGQTTFTPPSYTVGYIDVFRNGVLLGSADYTASNGTTVVLATGATAGDLITTESFYVSSVLNAIANSPASVSASNLAAGSVVLTGSAISGILPVANGGSGITATTYYARLLIVAGGGGGGKFNGGGGGGAGGVLQYQAYQLTNGTGYTVTVGNGGAGSTSSQGASGSNSVFGSLTATGGGGGGGADTSSSTLINGLPGGSGGGSATYSGVNQSSYGGAGTSGQGNNGGQGGSDASSWRNGGGGGGAGGNGAACGAVNVGQGGNGGNGIISDISGTPTSYGGGGGGGCYYPSSNYAGGGLGGVGGGGIGGSINNGGNTAAGNGTANTGGGGGGQGGSGAGVGNGGSGIIIVAYPGAQRGTGGTVTSANGFTIHTFTSSGTYTA